MTAGPTIVHLVRHGAHALLSHVLAGRMPDVALSPEGVAQAEALSNRFAGRDVAAVVSSPIQRARETAAPLAARLGRPVEIDVGWEEIDMGRWTGSAMDVLHADPDWQAWNRMRGLATCPGGEAMHQVQSRALLALQRLRAAHGEAEVVAVSHSDVIKAVLAGVLGWPLDHVHRLSIDPASISTVALFDDFVRVDGVNR